MSKILAMLLFVLATLAARAAPARADVASALGYLDGRADAWVSRKWSFVTGDHTCAVSCHTTAPYLLVRAAHPTDDTAIFAKVRGAVADRASHWDTVLPVYDFAKESSRATEAALNGTLLALADVRAGQALTEVSRTAVANAIAAQMDDGAWRWMDEGLSPFEDAAARYWGAALVARALAELPAGHGVEGVDAALAKVGGFLRAGFDGANLHGQMMAAYAAAKHPALLPAPKRKAVAAHLRSLQREDGSWSLAQLGSFRTKGGDAVAPESADSDAYATGFAVLVLGAAGVSREGAELQKAGDWLLSHQAADGSWPTRSLNDPGADFNNGLITDAATAEAVLALDLLGRPSL